jgi:hypothetical protein
MGFGFTEENRKFGIEGEELDCSPYISEDKIDPKWMEEVIKTGALVVDRV